MNARDGKDIWIFWESHPGIFWVMLATMALTTPLVVYLNIPEFLPRPPFFDTKNILPLIAALFVGALYAVLFWGALNVIRQIAMEEKTPARGSFWRKADPLQKLQVLDNRTTLFRLAFTLLSAGIYALLLLALFLVLDLVERHLYPPDVDLLQQIKYDKGFFLFFKAVYFIASIFIAHLVNSSILVLLAPRRMP